MNTCKEKKKVSTHLLATKGRTMTYNATIPDSHSVQTLSLPGVQDGFTDLHDLARWSHLHKTQRGAMSQTTRLAVFGNTVQARI